MREQAGNIILLLQALDGARQLPATIAFGYDADPASVGTSHRHLIGYSKSLRAGEIMKKRSDVPVATSITLSRVIASAALSISLLAPSIARAAPDKPQAVAPPVSAATTCPAAELGKFVCGVANSEDLVQLPKTHWVISSGKMGPGVPTGHLFVIDAKNKSTTQLYPDTRVKIRQNHKIFDSCPGPIDETRFDFEGINVRQTGDKSYTLYVINHGARESTEVFDVDTRSKSPMITWVGCVVTPPMPQTGQPAIGNAVAPLANGAFAITVNPAAALGNMKDSHVAEKLTKGVTTGLVRIWTPGKGWRTVPGSDLAGNNGIEASPDGKWLYVDALFAPAIYRLSLGRTPVDRTMIKTSFHPDNIRWGDDGFLYVTGPGMTEAGLIKDALACRASVICSVPFKVLRVDPRTLQTEELVNEPGGPLFGLGTGVAKIGRELWVSSVRGTRLAVFPLK